MKLISKLLFFVLFVSALVGAGLYYRKYKSEDKKGQFIVQEIKPHIGDIRLSVNTTGVVKPQNRLEIKPSINGRIEEIYVKEGDQVKEGQIIALMSSTERAALLDAARGQGEKTVAYWKDVYKATSLISPIDGEVIVRAVEPGQTVTSTTAVVVLSDRLIVEAQVDETDIGKVKKGLKSILSLDAYPETKIDGIVDHIAFESTLLNNVNIYMVNIIPAQIPDFFRSGMSATIELVLAQKNDVLLIPAETLTKENGENFVRIKGHLKPLNKKVEIGIQAGDMVEIISGITPDDTVLLTTKKYGQKKQQPASSPFMPYGRRKKSGN